jgi:hypothetical protein
MSALSEISPNSLSLLMNKSPLETSDEEVARICDILRNQRKSFILEEKSGKKKVAANPEMTLDDLGL